LTATNSANHSFINLSIFTT